MGGWPRKSAGGEPLAAALAALIAAACFLARAASSSLRSEFAAVRLAREKTSSRRRYEPGREYSGRVPGPPVP